MALPQVGGMYRGDQSRKKTLVDHGFRLPSAMDNRPLRFDGFEGRVHQAVYVSATPKEYEVEQSDGVVVEMIARPTGLLDPLVEIRPVATQVDDLLDEIKVRVEKNERVLVTTLTKKMAEDLTEYYREVGSGFAICTAMWTLSSESLCFGTCALERLTCWSVSTCSERGWIFRKCPWSGSWMRTRKDSFGRIGA